MKGLGPDQDVTKPTIGGRYGMGHGRPPSKPTEVRVPSQGWISHAPPFPEMGTKREPEGCEQGRRGDRSHKGVPGAPVKPVQG